MNLMNAHAFAWSLRVTAVLASIGLAGCGDVGVDDSGANGMTEQAWSSASCGALAVPSIFYVGGIDRAYTSPQTYNDCTKSLVLDVTNLSPFFAGSGSGGGPDATIYVSFADTLPTTQAGCEDLEGGAIFYKRVGSSWADLTGQLHSVGHWIPAGFFAARCDLPAASYSGLVAGSSYRIAATMRRISGGNPTRKVSIVTAPAVHIQ